MVQPEPQREAQSGQGGGAPIVAPPPLQQLCNCTLPPPPTLQLHSASTTPATLQLLLHSASTIPATSFCKSIMAESLLIDLEILDSDDEDAVIMKSPPPNPAAPSPAPLKKMKKNHFCCMG
ncbi:hypothetical protein FCV25MIE_04852 [Fagus crenata]